MIRRGSIITSNIDVVKNFRQRGGGGGKVWLDQDPSHHFIYMGGRVEDLYCPTYTAKALDR